jgi:hypothetical protein
MENKSTQEIVSIIEKKIMFTILEHLPQPSCKLKKQQNDWKIELVYRQLRDNLTNKIRK